jgi:hypothetical protein
MMIYDVAEKGLSQGLLWRELKDDGADPTYEPALLFGSNRHCCEGLMWIAFVG